MEQFTQDNVEITSQEKNHLKEYISQHHTAMLTVIFTDIQGYTELTERRGETYVTALRQHHDALIKGIVERENSGLVVKFIGDAVMAVFSEPTKAVERAVEIQRELVKFNSSHPEFEDIFVRVGMHLGQIAIEDDVQMDIFGRHVNRAARVESLAEGGQVLISFSVWDSARGWLEGQPDVQWVKHGSYLLKGISDPVEIYEVFDPNITTPKQPKSGLVKKRSPVALLSTALAVGLMAAWALFSFLTPKDVWINTSVTAPLYLNENLVQLGDENEDGFRKVLSQVSSGDQVLHYQVSSQLIYASDITLTGKQQFLEPVFHEVRAASIKVRNEVGEQSRQINRDFSFSSVSKNTYQGNWQLELASHNVQDKAIHDYRWSITLDGQEPIEGMQKLNHNINQSTNRLPEVVIWSDNDARLVQRIYMIKGIADIELKWEFIPDS